MYIPDSYLDELIASDIPSGIDLTTHVLGIGAQPGRMEYYTRDAALLCGTEEAARIFGRFGCTVVEALPSGSMLAPGDVFMTVEGPAAGLHMGWRSASTSSSTIARLPPRPGRWWMPCMP